MIALRERAEQAANLVWEDHLSYIHDDAARQAVADVIERVARIERKRFATKAVLTLWREVSGGSGNSERRVVDEAIAAAEDDDAKYGDAVAETEKE